MQRRGWRARSGGSRYCSSPLFNFFYLSLFVFYSLPLLFSSMVFPLTGLRGDRPPPTRHSNQSFPPPSLCDLLLAFILYIYLLIFWCCPRRLKKVLSFFMRSLSLDHRRYKGSPVICCGHPKELTWPGGCGWEGCGEWWWWGEGGWGLRAALFSHLMEMCWTNLALAGLDEY